MKNGTDSKREFFAVRLPARVLKRMATEFERQGRTQQRVVESILCDFLDKPAEERDRICTRRFAA